MNVIIRWAVILPLVFLGVALLMWGLWSRAVAPPPPVDLNIPPVPAPKPAPAEYVDPSFGFLSEPLYDDFRRLNWKVAYTLGELSDIAYADADGQRSRALKLGALRVTPLARNTSEGFVASDDHTVVVVFRGTADLKDIVTDVLGFPTYMKGGLVHRGFHRAIGSIYKDAVDAAREHGAADKQLFISGHSLGGAIACGFSMQLSKEKQLAPAGVITFGQPLVMSSALCQFMMDEYDDRYIRIVNGVDPITTLVNLYRHAGARARLRDGGEYDWRRPLIAPTAPPPGAAEPLPPRSVSVVDEDIPELKLISPDAAMELDRQIKESQNGPPVAAAPGAYGAFWANPIADHGMAGYLANLREVVRAKETASGKDDLLLK